jgi:hypothetical protein
MRRISVVVALLVAGCASGGERRPAAVEARDLPACGVSAPEARGPWHQVAATGFTFCVPDRWRSTGSQTWRGDAATLTWGMGEYRGAVQQRVVVVPAGQLPPDQVPGTRSNRFTEVIGGVRVELWESEVDGRLRAGGTWTQPTRIYMRGEAPRQDTIDLLLDIYRTVRFTDS